MGIPKFFRWITNKYDNLILDTPTNEIDNLYLDANGLIHPCCHKITANNPELIRLHNKDYMSNKNDINDNINIISKLEKLMFNEIINYIIYIKEYCKPKKQLYISIDGVAPRAKMEQQRLRRYRTFKEKNLIKEIHFKYDKEIKSVWDTNSITPGTLFMIKLSNYIKKNLNKTKNDEIKIILSDASIPGEGEHKIMEDIRNSTHDEINCIYGLDADLIMLSLCLDGKVYLLRESINFGKVNMDKLLYFSIEKLKEHLYSEICKTINVIEFELEQKKIIVDYVFLCFLLGNDFLPKLVNLDIGNNSINDLINIYSKILSIRKNYLINDISINYTFLHQILSCLYNSEDYKLKDIQNNIQKKKIYGKYYKNDFERDIEQLKFYPLLYKYKEPKINFNNPDWRSQYYKYYFNINNVTKSSEFLKDICIKYTQGLEWVLHYYIKGCICWKWYYPFRAAPCLRELSIYYSNRIYPTEFLESKPYNPLEQLTLVIPQNSFHLLPSLYSKCILDNIDLYHFYPDDFDVDIEKKLWFHECNPILPIIDDSKIITKITEITLNPIDKLRNTNNYSPLEII
uniref:Xrn1 N-terminal domain-containing protein n=1 Tax=viral metagenome TaxID=1070528 RepID=A0A6C0IVU8_9ZZZZ